MNPTTLSIGHTYIYNTNAGMIEVDYLGPFGPLPDAWHDFAFRSAYQDEIITVSALAVNELLTVSSQQVTKGASFSEEKFFPESVAPDTSAPAYMESESILKPDPEAAIVESKQLKVENEISPEEKNIPDIADYSELRTIDIVFTSKGGRLVTNTIEGTCVQNAVLHAYSYLYREASRGASDIRIHAGGRRVDIHNIRKYTPPALLNQLVAVSH